MTVARTPPGTLEATTAGNVAPRLQEPTGPQELGFQEPLQIELS